MKPIMTEPVSGVIASNKTVNGGDESYFHQLFGAYVERLRSGDDAQSIGSLYQAEKTSLESELAGKLSRIDSEENLNYIGAVERKLAAEKEIFVREKILNLAHSRSQMDVSYEKNDSSNIEKNTPTASDLIAQKQREEMCALWIRHEQRSQAVEARIAEHPENLLLADQLRRSMQEQDSEDRQRTAARVANYRDQLFSSSSD
ncbi:hypothetical protein [Spongiibacter marinus]|uniref:hypothetical protein n=1 Tax=Spongiibacter marinus TaxID=354246 RepID=UPI00041D19E8|nr:hypothetical protein [Spongiibacter marinus]